MKQLTILVGPPGSGKSTLAKEYQAKGHTRVNQDSQGADHIHIFHDALRDGLDIVVDRMNFNVEQRRRFSGPALDAGYKVEVIVLHESYETCFKRIMARQDHETIKDETGARAALHTFFSKYERPVHTAAIPVTFLYPPGLKPKTIVVDLDGTLCNVEHRRHFVRREGKKDWTGFFKGIADDTINVWCKDIVDLMAYRYEIVFCSGRGQEHEQVTRDWLNKHINKSYTYSLFMRSARDSRQDFVVKEILLDFEILTRFTPHFMIDDRQQVVDLWRRRGFTCLQCDIGDF